MVCPNCNNPGIWRNEVDVGVGIIYGPYGCNHCGWSEWEYYDYSKGESQAQIDNPNFIVDSKGGMYREKEGSFMAKKKDLVQIIQDNPGCVAVIDNDGWDLVKTNTLPTGWDKMTDEQQEEWTESQKLCDSSEPIKQLGDGGYGSGADYGGDILQACAIIAGIKVESV